MSVLTHLVSEEKKIMMENIKETLKDAKKSSITIEAINEEHNRAKRFEWPWETIGKELCKTAAKCSCGWAKCVPSPGYKASNCCGENYVWSCCGKPVN
uniref:Toxin n=1 Tax=Meloidogyne hapla TaxID=6305 RepID=A0A1I8B7V7_MELHA